MSKQSGVSFIGFLFIAVLIAGAALVGFKVAPVYIEFFTVKRILNATAMDSVGAQPQEIRLNFDRRALADYVDSVRSGDMEISKDGGQVVLTIAYTKKVPLVSNVSLLFEFETTARR